MAKYGKIRCVHLELQLLISYLIWIHSIVFKNKSKFEKLEQATAKKIFITFAENLQLKLLE